MKRYSLGFIFDTTLKKVLLIHKKHPEWQAGKINGLGGKIEARETSLACIVREIQEEAGLITTPRAWQKIGEITSQTSQVFIYATTYEGILTDAKTCTDEEVEWFPVNKLPSDIMSNLSWLVPLSIDKLRHSDIDTFIITYNF